MRKIAICGHFSNINEKYNGQTVKTTILTNELEKQFPSERIMKIDTSKAKKNPLLFFLKCFIAILKYENIIILPAQSAVRIMVPFFASVNIIFNRRLHYYVVGGWLKNSIDDAPKLLRYLRRFTGIYVELNSMKSDLESLELSNVVLVKKFGNTTFVDKRELCLDYKEPHKLCFYSRVIKEKGIEDAIDAVNAVNEKYGRIVYTLDIYGPIDEDRYGERFKIIQKGLPDSIRYMGIIEYGKATPILKNYYAMLFPTYYSGEGYANVVVDAFAAGLPVIATDWKYNSEVIRDGMDGIIYKRDELFALESVLDNIAERPHTILKMKENVCDRASEYIPSRAIEPLLQRLR